jgi:hypothetical protein
MIVLQHAVAFLPLFYHEGKDLLAAAAVPIGVQEPLLLYCLESRVHGKLRACRTVRLCIVPRIVLFLTHVVLFVEIFLNYRLSNPGPIKFADAAQRLTQQLKMSLSIELRLKLKQSLEL